MTQEEWEQSITQIGIVAGCVIRQDDKYLLIQEKQPKVYGLWNLPAGYVDKNEEVDRAAIREVKEETGYDVELDGLIGLYHETTRGSLKHIYKAHIVGGELKIPEDEILNARWLTYDEVNKLHDDSKLRAFLVFDAISKMEAEA